MQVFKTLEQITSFDSYKKLIKPALMRLGSAPEKYHFVERFKFDKKNGPVLLIGDLPKEVLEGVKEAGSSPLVQGRVKQDNGKLAFSSSGFNVDKMQAALRLVDVALEPVSGTATEEDAAISADKDKRAAELEAVRVSRQSVDGKAATTTAKTAVGEMLTRTGRDTNDQAKREIATGKILQGMEKTVNDRRAIEEPTRAPAHGVSAHGKGTDQVSRLVSGRRADEVAEETAKGKTPVARTSLFGNSNPKIPSQEIPSYKTVGDDASNISGAFSTNTGMLHVIEEAYAQAAQLDSYIAAELKTEYNAQMETVQSHPSVQAIVGELTLARTAVKDAQGKLKTAKDEPAAQKLVQEIQNQEASIKVLGGQLRSAVASVKSTLATGAKTQPNERRVAFDIKDDGNSTEGLGRGLKIEDSDNALPLSDKPGAALNAKAPGKTPDEVMQDRFKKIKQTDPIKSGTVVMDPSYVTDESGKKRRSGWDVQTAFPSGRAPGAPLQDKAAAKKFVDGSREEMRVDALKAIAKEATAAYEKAKADREKLALSIKATEANQKHWPAQLEGAKKKLNLAAEALKQARASNIKSGIEDAEKLFKRAQEAPDVENNKGARLLATKADLIKLIAAEAKAKDAADAAVTAIPVT